MHGKELSQFISGETVRKHVTCVVLAINSFHTAGPALQFFLQPDASFFQLLSCDKML